MLVVICAITATLTDAQWPAKCLEDLQSRVVIVVVRWHTPNSILEEVPKEGYSFERYRDCICQEKSNRGWQGEGRSVKSVLRRLMEVDATLQG